MLGRTRKPGNEEGIVSITLTMVMILVISLTVVGFTQVANRNSREALDRQLSNQAYYAAETGVNDAMNRIAQLIQTGQVIPTQDDCNKSKDNGGYTQSDGKVGAIEGVAYTCLLVNPQPSDLQYDNVSSSAVVSSLNAVDSDGNATDLGEHILEWKTENPKASGASINKCTVGSSSSPSLPKSEDWPKQCPYGLLSVDLTPIQTDTVADPLVAMQKTMSLFIYPKAGSTNDNDIPNVAYEYANPNNTSIYSTSAPQARIVTANCDESVCKIRLSGLNFTNAYVKVRSVYKPSETFRIAATDNKHFERSQAIVDVTGKAQDVLKRIQVRISLVGGVGGSTRTDVAGFSDYALQTSDSLCKRYVISPEKAADTSGCAY